jgi:hypothetical protein
MLPEPTRCSFTGCTEFGGHQHHITYDPEWKEPLCESHHKEITHLNAIQSRKYHYIKLSNRFRRWIWFQWIEGKLKPRRTRKAQEWTDDWNRNHIIFIAADPNPLPRPERTKSEPVPKKRSGKKKTAAKKGTRNGRRVNSPNSRRSRSEDGKRTVRKLPT